ncbi:MAG: hypothetical protein RR292_05515 [Christensenellaceae bacterium]
MELNNNLNNNSKSHPNAFKMLCVISAIAGVYLVIRAFTSSSSVVQMMMSGGLNIGGIGVLILIIALLVPAMLILAGIFGYMNKLKATIVLSIIAFIISLYSLITNTITLSMTADLKLILANLIPMVAVTATALLLAIYAIINKKHPQD